MSGSPKLSLISGQSNVIRSSTAGCEEFGEEGIAEFRDSGVAETGREISTSKLAGFSCNLCFGLFLLDLFLGNFLFLLFSGFSNF